MQSMMPSVCFTWVRPRVYGKVTRPSMSCSTSPASGSAHGSPAPGSSGRRRRWRSAGRPRCRRPASPGSRRRRPRERRRRRRCCRRSRPETAASGFRARCTRPGCPRSPSVTQTIDAPGVAPHDLERAAQVLVPGQRGGKFLGGDDRVDVLQQVADAGPHLLDVDDRRDPRLARVARRPRGRRGLMAVDDQQPSRRHRILRHVGRLHVQRRDGDPRGPSARPSARRPGSPRTDWSRRRPCAPR